MSWLDLDQTDRGGKDLSAALTDFAAREGDDTLATLYRDFLRRHPDAFLRSCHSGHFTGSAWVISADGQRSLLTHHKKLGRWLQPGGHADGDTNLARVALREAEEETGLSGLRVAPAIFDLDRHRIPARGVEPEHWHYDVRYVVRAGVDENFVVSDESNALAWREITALASDDTVDPSLRRMAQRWVARQPV